MPEKYIELSSLLLSGSQEEAWKLLSEIKNSGQDSLYIYEELVAKAMAHIGYLWEKNEVTVADEHLATSTCEFILARYQWEKLREQEVPPKNQKAMFLCLQHEQHHLGLKMACNLFEESGWETRFMGPNLPLEYATTAAKEWKPDVISLSFSIIYHAEQLREYIEELESLPNSPIVIVGGRLISQYSFASHTSERTVLISSLAETQNWINHYPQGVETSVS
ncbi:cobalamin B12-binding domain-containing protein [Priestia filamentosa]|uniref:Cobalamin-binding protein n=1 Tax=Priestia filamentosa TaxID=1402861 RepID=A0A1X7G4Q5_9BACI|nr:cobalamin-dependent protein [Priestia filamentosa]AKO92069.1 cobalamin-binding protein [Priestia filamentosa]MDT3762072.1 cobalamin-dependent protein [Priestia filamentosa]OXS65946.1 cobalamin-binding protein [Priestia filamentosa]WCM17159.1 cobalamin-dependent protein [Priestia filamentosa]WRU96571.1 cobalamin-dependent protein [Priestia filamentosa]